MVDNNNMINMSLMINGNHHDHDEHHHHHRHDHDHLLPIANVGRLMKKILPANAKVSKEAKETMQECATEFISFVTGEASDRCRRELRKTVNGSDICGALQALGFDEYSGPLRHYLNKYRDGEVSRSQRENPPARDGGANINGPGTSEE